jgi:NAD(P)-dependent dehydrogenase (short-subunit alcohol dehydrogenase family)
MVRVHRLNYTSAYLYIYILTTALAADRETCDPNDPLSSLSVEAVTREFAVNVISPTFAAQEAVKGFKQLPSSASRAFIMTGNVLNVLVKPDVLTFSMGKVAAARLIESLAVAYKPKGFK